MDTRTIVGCCQAIGIYHTYGKRVASPACCLQLNAALQNVTIEMFEIVSND